MKPARYVRPLHSANYFLFATMLEIWNNITSTWMGVSGATSMSRAIGNDSRSLSENSKIQQREVQRPTLKILTEEQVQMLCCGSYEQLYGYKCLDSAVLVLNIARSLDHRLHDNPNVSKFYSFLTSLSKFNFSRQSFQGKTVISIEGLEGSGKTTIASIISEGCQSVVFVQDSDLLALEGVRSIFTAMPAPVKYAYELVGKYAVAYHIAKSEKAVFVVENYYHALCTKSICDRTNSNVLSEQLPQGSYEWPYELPMPLLVVFLSVSTATRFQRLRSRANIDDRIVMDNKANIIYSKICGPGTVGIDANAELTGVLDTVLEALDYYGVYEISRDFDPSRVTTKLTVSNDVKDDQVVTSVPFQVEDERSQAPAEGTDIIDSEDLHIRYSISPSKQKRTSRPRRRSSLLISSHAKQKLAMSAQQWEENTENADPQDSLSELPEDVIANRRISMGVYGMFTKL